MKRELYRLVNTAYAGEPEHIALQQVGGFDILELNEIDKVSQMVSGIKEWDSERDLHLLL